MILSLDSTRLQLLAGFSFPFHSICSGRKKCKVFAHLSHVLDKDYAHRLICYLQISSVESLGGSQQAVTADVGSCPSESSEEEPCNHELVLHCLWHRQMPLCF